MELANQGTQPVPESDKPNTPGAPPPPHGLAAAADRLLELLASAGPAEREQVVNRLRQAGLAAQPATAAGLPQAASRALQQALSQGPRDQLNVERTLELAAMLADLTLKLDAMMTDIWRKVAPQSSIRKAATLRVTLARFAAGDDQTTRAQAEAELTLLRQITAGIASAISRAAPQVARRHLDRFGAAEVERAVRDEGSGGLGLDAKCWKKYQQVCATLDAEAAERELLAVIAEHAEKLIRSTR